MDEVEENLVDAKLMVSILKSSICPGQANMKRALSLITHLSSHRRKAVSCTAGAKISRIGLPTALLAPSCAVS